MLAMLIMQEIDAYRRSLLVLNPSYSSGAMGRIHTLYAKNVCFGFIILLFILSCRITPFTFLFLISLYPSYYDGYVVYNKR
ncbi:hypothetical protein DWW69_01485 [Bacteroides sp. AF16-49]|nr:hypothetical protein DXB63_02635 [Bacteroides sp. OM05-12]RHR82087.1 hypothetical protein DWW69_01485 [Bacteroides sp. AF16-49]